MNAILSRFSFDPSKIDGKILAILVLLWAVTLACGVSSVLSHGADFTRKQRVGWLLLLIFVPVLGLLVYLPFSLKRDGFVLNRPTKSNRKPVASLDSKAS